MKIAARNKFFSYLLLILIGSGLEISLIGQTAAYWDVDGSVDGAGGPSPSGVWNSGLTPNWNSAADGTGTTNVWTDGNIAVFAAGTNATGTYTVTVSGSVTADSVRVEEGTVNLDQGNLNLSGSATVNVATNLTASINSTLGGGSGFVKDGPGSLILSNNTNSWTGATIISNGTVVLGAKDVIPDNSDLTVGTNGTLNLANFGETVGSLSGAGSVALGSGGLTNGGNAQTTVFPGVMSGTGKFTLTGGMLTLSGSNTYSGVTTVEGGTLQLGGSERIANASGVTLGTGTTFDLNGFNETIGSLSGAGAVNLNGGNLTFGADNTTKSHSGAISGTGKLTKIGTATQTITGANTYSNGIVIAGGIFAFNGETSATLGNANPLGMTITPTIANYLTISNGATLRSTRSGGGSSFVLASRGITIGSGGAILDASSAVAGNYLLYNGIIAGTGALTKVGACVIQLQSAASSFRGAITNKAGGGLGVDADANLGNVTNLLVFSGGDFVCFASRTTLPISNPFMMISNTTICTLTNLLSGTRTLPFSNVNVTAVSGTWSNRNRGSAGSLFGCRWYSGGFTWSRPIVIGDPSDVGDVRFELYAETNQADTYFTGPISGPGKLRRTTDGYGTGGKTILTATNTYAGGTDVNGGYLGLGVDSEPAGATSGSITGGPIGTGNVSVGEDPTPGFFAYGGPRVVGNDMVFAAAATNLDFIGTNDLTWIGAISLNGTTLNSTIRVLGTRPAVLGGPVNGGVSGRIFYKSGPGVLILTNANSYGNDTVVGQGTLLANNAVGSGTSFGTVTVASGGTLGGTGMIAGAVTVNNGGSIAAGASAGILTLQNGLNLSAGGTNIWELAANSTNNPGTDFDQLLLTGGNLALGGSSRLAIRFTGTATSPTGSNPFWQATNRWTIISLAGGSNTGSTNFTSITGTNGITAGKFATSVDGSGNIILTFTPSSIVIPPPPVISTNIPGAGTGSAQISWSSVSGANYQVQFKTNVDDAVWNILTNITATGTSTSIIDSTSPSPKQRFYRVISP